MAELTIKLTLTLTLTLSNPGSNPGHGRLLPSGSFLPPHPSAGFLCLKLGGVLFCPPAAKGAGGPQPGVVVAERLRRWT